MRVITENENLKKKKNVLWILEGKNTHENWKLAFINWIIDGILFIDLIGILLINWLDSL